MDLHGVQHYRLARTRCDLRLTPGERILAGGTWLFSEPQPQIAGLVDLAGMDWPALRVTDGGLSVAATCTIAELARWPERPDWPAQRLFAQCAAALLASWKVQGVATVGGNICRAYAAASMVSLAAALDAIAVVWTPDGGERRTPVTELVAGNGESTLGPGEVLRSIEFPGYALRSRTGFRRIALAELGRSGAVLTGRVDADGTAVFGITAATLRPVVLRYPALPDPAVLRRDVAAADGYYTDPQGNTDWRRAVSATLAGEIAGELAAA